MGCSGSLAPHFINNDYLTAEIIYSTAQAHHEVLAWLWATLCGTPVWAPHNKSSSQERILLWPLCQPGEGLCYVRLCYGCCYGCSVNQERINVSAVPVAPWVSFQPLGLCLAYPGFSEQWGQWDTMRQLVPGTRCRAIQLAWLADTQWVEEPGAPVDGRSQWPLCGMWYHVAMILDVGSGGRLGSGRWVIR